MSFTGWGDGLALPIIPGRDHIRGERGQLAVVEAGHEVGEADDGSHDRHHPGVPEPQRGCVLAVDLGRPGHLVEGDHVRGRLGIGCLSVTQTLVGGVANGSEGVPVLGVDPPADPEVPGVADHRLGA